MAVIHMILAGLWCAIFLLLGLPLMGIMVLISKKDKAKSEKISAEIIRFVFRVILFLSGVRLEVTGKENLIYDEPVLYCSNHEGIFDIVTTYTLIPGRCGIVAKQELAKVPIFATWCRLIGVQFLNRQNAKEGLKTVLNTIQQVKDGASILIYPEGTRNENPGDGLLPFKDGSLKIAQKARCKVIPVAIYHTGEVFETQAPMIRGKKIPIRFGEPIDLSTLSKEELAHAGAYVQEKVAVLHHEIED